MSDIEKQYPFIFSEGDKVRIKSSGHVFIVRRRQRNFQLCCVNCYGCYTKNGLEFWQQDDLELIERAVAAPLPHNAQESMG